MTANGSSQHIVRDLFNLPDEVIPTQENVLDDFSCAWQKDVKVFGRLFCTDRSLCFYAHLLGYRTKLVIPFKEVMNIRKERTAFSKGISVGCTNNRLYVFGSFQNSQEAFLFLQRVWRSHCSVEEGDMGSNPHSDWSDDDVLTEENDESSMFTGNEDPFKAIRKIVLELTPMEFFEMFLRDGSEVTFSQVWAEMGYTQIRCSQWFIGESPKTYSREASYRIFYKDGLFYSDSSRIHEDQRVDIDDNKLVLRTSSKALDTPYHDHYSTEQEWTVTQISHNRSLLRCCVAIKFVKPTKMKKLLTDYITEEVEHCLSIWEQRFQQTDALPEVSPHSIDVSTYKLVKYEEVDLKKVNSSFMNPNKTDLVLWTNTAALIFAVLFILYLHYRLSTVRRPVCS